MWWNRCDGDLVRSLPRTRRVMPYLMRGRNESAVWFEQAVDLTRVEPALAEFTARTGLHVTVFHVVLGALARTLHERPGINRFVAGGRLYQRRGVHLAWAAKESFDDDAPLVTVKRTFPPGESFEDLVRDIDVRDDQAKRQGDRATDRELATVLALPGIGRRAALGLIRRADALGMLPAWYVDPDPMYVSAFLANLGSVGLDAGFHHLYEYGTASLFCAIGRVRETAAPTGDGATHPEVVLRLTFDERVEDGLYARRSLERFREVLEDPNALGVCT